MLRRLLLLVVLALLAASAVLFVWAPFATEHPKKADAIVVLAGSNARLPVALKLLHDGVAPTLAVSRDAGDDVDRIRLCRLPPAHVFCFQAAPYSTRGEARAIARFVQQRGWRSVVVVSSRYHLFRVRLLVRRCANVGLQVVPTHVSWFNWPKAVALEWAKLVVAETARRGC